MAHIIVFGTSIDQGFYDTEYGGWVERLKAYLNKKTVEAGGTTGNLFYSVFNLGISGDTTEGVLKRFSAEIRPRLSSEDKNIVIFSVGANDSQRINSEKDSFKVSKIDFRKNIKALIDMTKNLDAEPVFLGLTLADEEKVDPIPWAPEFSYLNELIEEYDSVLKDICEEKGLLFIDVLPEFKKQDYSKLLVDGIHPNSQGHQFLFEVVKKRLKEESLIV